MSDERKYKASRNVVIFHPNGDDVKKRPKKKSRKIKLFENNVKQYTQEEIDKLMEDTAAKKLKELRES